MANQTTKPHPLLLWRLIRAAGIAAFLFFIIQAAYYSIFIYNQFPRERENCLAESSRVERTLAVAKGLPLFTDLTTWPHNAAGAGHLLFIPPGYIMRIIGLPDTLLEQANLARFLGRLQSFGGFLLILLALFFFTKPLNLQGLWRFLPVLAFFSARLIYKYAYAFRPDLIMIALVLWAWYIMLTNRSHIAIILSTILMVLAFGLKPTALASAGTLGLWLLLSRDFKRAAIYAAASAVGFGGYLLAVKIASPTHGTALAGKALQTDIYWKALYEIPGLIAAKPLGILPLAGGMAAAAHFLFKPDASIKNAKINPRAIILAFTCSLITSELIIMRPGSNAYYFLEPYCWGLLITTLLTHRGARSLRHLLTRTHSIPLKNPRLYLWALLLGLILILQLKTARNLWADRAELHAYPSFAERHPKLVKILQNTRGEVLMDEAYPYWYTQAPPTLLIAQGYSTLVESGALSPEELIKKIQEQDFEIILLNYDASESGLSYQEVEVFPPGINAAISDAYRFAMYLQPYYIYKPNRTNIGDNGK